MSVEYVATFQCRLCKQAFETARTGADIAYIAMTELVAGFPTQKTVQMTDVHSCNDGSFGMADFIGFKKYEKEDERPVYDSEFPF